MRDGSLDVVGFDPVFGFYQNGIGGYQPLGRRQVLRRRRQVVFSKDPAWAKLLTLAEGLDRLYGYDKLVKWQTGAGDEFSASHAFERGKLAMMLDGEWRVAFLKAEHPELRTGRRPCRSTTPSRASTASGYINGTIIGIPKSGKNRDEAWKLVKYLTTNDHALATFSNGIRNVPSTVARRSRRS